MAGAQRARAVHGRDLRELRRATQGVTPGIEASAATSGGRSTRVEPGLLGREDDPIEEYLRFRARRAGVSAAGRRRRRRHLRVTGSRAARRRPATGVRICRRCFPRCDHADTSSCGRRTSSRPSGTRCRSCSWRASCTIGRSLDDGGGPARGAGSIDLLVRSGRDGLSDPMLGAKAPVLCDLALDGCAALGAEFVEPVRRREGCRVLRSLHARGRSPADD